MTIELWVQPMNFSDESFLCKYGSVWSTNGLRLGLARRTSTGRGGAGSVYADLPDLSGEVQLSSAPRTWSAIGFTTSP